MAPGDMVSSSHGMPRNGRNIVSTMSSLAVAARTAHALGLHNLWRVISYRIGVKFGINSACRLRARLQGGPFFTEALRPIDSTASSAWRDEAHYFGRFLTRWAGLCPDWLVNPFCGCRATSADLPWWQISDFLITYLPACL